MAKQLTNTNDLILEFIKANPLLSSKEIHDGLTIEISYATIKRTLQALISENLVLPKGKGKATKYQLSEGYSLLQKIDISEYFQKEIDERNVHESFNHSLITNTLSTVSVFTAEEFNHLDNIQKKYAENISRLTDTEYNKELERLAIDLSWKSSQIEGNTYSLLETERLLKEKEEAKGKTKEEAIMLLNHKKALDFIIVNPKYVTPLSVHSIEDIHSLLIGELNIERNIRKGIVRITGTNYKPLDNEHQIREALEDMCVLVNMQREVFSKALLVLVLLSYIQPFEDGNKRTARIISNAILLDNGYCPISFRTIDSIEYKKAMLLFYEQNNITAFKRIFIDQFEFAVKTYF